jgi:Arc/MetJ-type ribon-helix-helix transcriptional regulator
MTTDQAAFSVSDWLTGRLPADWFTAVAVTVDREEILIHGTIPAPEGADAPDAEAGRITRFREDTRSARIEIARELEARTGRKVAWGVTCGATGQVFTRLSVPVMTRLQQPQRQVLDTLVEAGVARSRSDALSWCVRLVAQHEGDWLTELDAAMSAVRTARAKGPTA